MKRHVITTILAVIVLLLQTSALVYAQNLIWAKRAGGTGSEVGYGIVVD